MNGPNGFYGQPPPAAVPTWQEFRSPDGRVYYFNSLTKETQWTKPEDMMTPAERALANQPWKEYTAEGGRKYWYNTETKQSTWEVPEAYKKALGPSATPTTPSTPSGFPPVGGYGGSGFEHQRDVVPESRQLTFGGEPKAQAFVPATNEPEYASAEEAEAAFIKLLRRSGIQPDWTYEQGLRVIARDPQFRAIKDPKDRKATFEKFCYDILVQDKERAKERLTKLRTDFATMLRSHPEIKHYTRWKTARPMIEGETIFRSTNNENERRQLFDDYIADLKKTHREQQTAMRKSAVDGVIDLLPKLNLEPYSRWSEAQSIIAGTKPFQSDEKYKTLSKFDILTVFQNHMKALERGFNDSRQEAKTKRFRKDRQARDAFKSLLSSLRKDGKIKAGSKWSQVFPLIEKDERYRNMVGQNGSTPQDLFWDVVEEEEHALRGTRNDVEDVIDDTRFEITPKTTLESFLAVMKEDRRTANIDRDILNLIFERLQEKKKEKHSDEERQSERQQRRAQEDLRSFMKRLDPPVSVHDTYERVRPRIAKSEEFQAVLSEDARRGAFDKHIRRLREKENEAMADKDRQRRREREDRGYRERDRGERLHRHGGRRTRSRSPEPDSYEADRRKAIAERERNYRKSSMADTLLSPHRPSDTHHESFRDRERERDGDRDRPKDRERDRDRHRDDDRPLRSRRDEGSGSYDRERRDREEERERQYRRRVVDKDPDELNYGDDKPNSSRRRRDDDDEERKNSRDSKRLRRESPRERTPQRDHHHKNREAAPPKEEPSGVHSGSEEGEIEED